MKEILKKIGEFFMKLAPRTPSPSVTNTTTVQRISTTKALELMQNHKNKFFTAVFIKKDGTERVINAEYNDDQPKLNQGYVIVADVNLKRVNPNNCLRSINLQTLKTLKINGVKYRIR